MPESTLEKDQHDTIESPYRISWRRVLKIILPIFVLFFAIAYWFVGIYTPSKIEAPTTVPTPDFQESTPSAKPATSSAQKDETADWEKHISKKYNYQISYPNDKGWSTEPHPDSEESQDPISTARIFLNNKFSIEIKVFSQFSIEVPDESETIEVGKETGYYSKSETKEKVILFSKGKYGYSVTFLNTNLFSSESEFEEFVKQLTSTFKFLE